MDAPEHDPMKKNALLELAGLARQNDKESWRLETNVVACKQNSIHYLLSVPFLRSWPAIYTYL